MIAFDLDGVFIPDLHFNKAELDTVLNFRHTFMTPIFEPEGPYYIITGRPVSDKQYTLEWIKNNFKNPPLKIFHDNPDFQRASEYKVEVLMSNPEIDIFIESDIMQVQFIEKNMKRSIEIIHFPTFISESIRQNV